MIKPACCVALLPLLISTVVFATGTPGLFDRTAQGLLVIVTADHAHARQIIPPKTKAPGLTQALNTKDGAIMVMSYGNSEEESQGALGYAVTCGSLWPPCC